MLRCTIGVMAYNEERNIEWILQALLRQQVTHCVIDKIIVIASGCTDRTVALAQGIAQRHPLIMVEAEAKRLGKAAAINRLIALAQTPMIVVTCADTLPDPLAVERLVAPFADSRVGMTGGRIVPLNSPQHLIGFAVQMLWHLHHRMALRWPKLGEIVAFRKSLGALPTDTATDEVALEAITTRKGYTLKYVPEALVYILGPQNLADFIAQRRRIFSGHLQIKHQFGYVAASVPLRHLWILTTEAAQRYPHLMPHMTATVLLEALGRLLGMMDYYLFRHVPAIWKPIKSTKQVGQLLGPLTLLSLQCPSGTVHPAQMMRETRQIQANHGLLFWWDQWRDQVMFLLPDDPATPQDIESRVRHLAQHFQPRQASQITNGLGYRMVRFAPSPFTHAAAYEEHWTW